MNDKEIIEVGYHSYKPTPIHSEYISQCFQKRFDDDTGKKYFIDIEKMDSFHLRNGDMIPDSYTFTTQLTKNGRPFNIELFSGWSIEEAEKFIEELWNKLDLDYYEEW